MKILKPISDEESMEILKKLTGEEIFQSIRNFELDEKYFELCVSKGLLKGLIPEQILLIAAEGGSLKYIEKAHIELIKEKNNRIKDILNEAIIAATKFSHLQIIDYLVNFGGDINMVLISANGNQRIQNFAIKNGAKIHSKITDRTTGESHSVLWYLLKEINLSIADYVESSRI